MGGGSGRWDRCLSACPLAISAGGGDHQHALHRSHRRGGGAAILSGAVAGARRTADGSVLGRHQHCCAYSAAQHFGADRRIDTAGSRSGPRLDHWRLRYRSGSICRRGDASHAATRSALGTRVARLRACRAPMRPRPAMPTRKRPVSITAPRCAARATTWSLRPRARAP